MMNQMNKQREDEEEKIEQKDLEELDTKMMEQQKNENIILKKPQNISGFFMRNSRYKPGIDSIAVSLKKL